MDSATGKGGGVRRQYGPEVPPVRRRELFAWACYDFANSGYTTVVITAVFNAYFVAVVAGNAAWATLAWTLGLSLSYALVIIAAPVLGAYSDRRANKLQLLWITTIGCVLSTAALALCGPGDVWLALVLIVVSNLAYSLGESLIAAFLPELAADESMGRLSGFGWAFGYVGGLLVLGICLVWILGAPGRGVTDDVAIRQTMLITAIAFAVSAVPTLTLLRERSQPTGQATAGMVATALAGLKSSIASSRDLPDLRRFLICIVWYQSGVATVITLAAVFTTQALGFSTQESIVLVLVVNVTAAVGAFVFGLVQDRLGHRRTLAITLVGWLLAILLFFLSDARWVIWTAANFAGLSLGASQSAGRALVGYLCPPEREGEIFGLWGLAVRVAMILGPLSYGFVNWFSGGNHRIALQVTALFFVVGLVQLFRVDVVRGHALARQPAGGGADRFAPLPLGNMAENVAQTTPGQART